MNENDMEQLDVVEDTPTPTPEETDVPEEDAEQSNEAVENEEVEETPMPDEDTGADNESENVSDESEQMEQENASVDSEEDSAETSVSDKQDSVEGVESVSAGDTIYEVTATVEHRPIMSTPLNEYTVEEGLLLMILIVLVGRWIWDFGRKFF